MSATDPNEAHSASSPYVQKSADVDGNDFTPTVKSYNNTNYLMSREGRLIRILCEFQEPDQRLRRHGIRSTVLVFGSARSMRRADFDETVRRYETQLADDTQRAEAAAQLARLRRTEWMCEWVEKVYELSRRLALFARAERAVIDNSFSLMPDYFSPETGRETGCADLVITTGGGPGFMEAANRGAAEAGAKTMGMGISLPFEKGLNPYVTRDLAFEFHYFFTRKFWMMYSCRAIVIAPGGFGTLDEMFELLTLRQTRKIPDIPVVLFCSKFWKTVVNWQALADFGTVSQEEVDGLCFADTVEEALRFIQNFFESKIKEKAKKSH